MQHSDYANHRMAFHNSYPGGFSFSEEEKADLRDRQVTDSGNSCRNRHRRCRTVDESLLASLVDNETTALSLEVKPPVQPRPGHRRTHSQDDKFINPIGIPETYITMSETNLPVEGPRFMAARSPIMTEEITAEIKIANQETRSPHPLKEDLPQAIDWKTPFQHMLYDKPAERDALYQAYRRIKSKDTRDSDCILISGASGTGKTYLAKTLRGVVEMDGGYFLTGKFDQLQRPEPFRAFVAAFTGFTKAVLKREPDVIATVKDDILAAVGHEIGVLTGFIPSIQKLVGRVDNSSPHVAGDAVCRFAYVIRGFMRAICSREHPVVLFFDDMHWADNCSLDLLRAIIADKECEGLIFVGTCLDTVSPTSNLSTALRRLEDECGARITNISMGNLSCCGLRRMVSETFLLSEEHCRILSDIIVHQTDGSVVYVMEFMRWLEDEGLLKFNQGAWRWDEQEIKLTIECNRIGDFLLDKLERLPKDVQEVLKVAACLGSTIEKPLINLLMQKDVGELLTFAWDKDVLLIQQDEYQFPTDGVQRAAYALIPSDEREAFHLSIGRQLLKILDRDQLEENLFTVLSQLKIGQRLIDNQTEKNAIAMVCLHAGKVAARSSAYRAACEYLEFGITLLSPRRWFGDETDLTLALYNAAAEVALCRSNFERLDELIGEVLGNTRRPEEQLQAWCTKIYALGVRDRQLEAINIGIEVLKGIGETFPFRLCRAHLLKEMNTVERLLCGKQDEQILRQPAMTDFKKIMAMRILNVITLDCLMARPGLSPFVVLKMVTLTMKYGLSELASASFAL